MTIMFRVTVIIIGNNFKKTITHIWLQDIKALQIECCRVRYVVTLS